MTSRGQDMEQEKTVLDEHGRPTTLLCFNMLKVMLKEHSVYFSTNDLCSLLAARKNDVSKICGDLHSLDFISANPLNPSEFKYNIHCKNNDLQCNFERYLIEVETEKIPIHECMPYSPSTEK